MDDKFNKLIGPKKEEDESILGILPKVPLSNHQNTRININCHFIDYNDSEQRRGHYFDFISNSILSYILERKELDKATHHSDYVKLSKEAKSKIWEIANQENEKNDGLLGEWNLYLFLEYIENAKKLVSRMSLDTSTQGNRKGLDGVHFKIEDGNIYIYLGEAKIYKDIELGLKDALGSINKFFVDDRYHKEQIHIIKEHLDLSGDKELEDFLLNNKIFTPSSTKTANEILSIFIMFDCNSLKEIEEKHKKDFKSREAIIKEIEDYYTKYFEEKIYKEIEDNLNLKNFKLSGVHRSKEDIEEDKKSGIEEPKKTETIEIENKIKNKQFIFYFIPVKDVDNLRKDFKNHLSK
ncbi:MAG: DUF1837 domain-containing protein [Candidatus Gracilibacteria bacterium]|nr:DUF1837 domain-containing protein [Candidatus Gracilibacteria bacterium]